MPRLYRQGDEPVSGYRLTRLIGKGTFGEVWQAAAPTGTEVAFKILDVNERTGLKQWRSLQKLKKIRHPNLVPVLALWLRDEFGDLILEGAGSLDQTPAELYLALGLGEKSLLDRLKECKDQGDGEVPVGELLNYLEDAARGLDHLNSPKHDIGAGPAPLPHGNLKPQNILIVGDAAQVCDFGLQGLLGEQHATKQASLSVAFTAPELLEGQSATVTTDQYSLAIIFYYLRTGYLPYSRNDPDTILLEALEGRLDLTKLNAGEQEVMRQATALKPTSRYPTCLDMAREMRRAVEHAGTSKGNLLIEPGNEAVPGHKLVRCLGRGAYGEVWEALAPGRVPVALKIIRDLDRAGGRGKQEFKALEIIQKVSHNNLMELRAYWLLDKHGEIIPDEVRGRPGSPTPTTLIIASKLADKNLGQLLEECLAHGEVGVPPKILLSHLKQIAQALDYLNSPRHRLGERLVSIQHRDVKPDNIMIAGEVAKLTDFGLAKVVELEETSAEIHQDSVGFTFHYASPEVLRGRVTKWSDQYALAITYYYLRTSQLPFDRATSAYELMMQQLEGRLDLSYLPEGERRIVARATSVVPDKRFHSCTSFIESLEMALPADGVAPLAKKPPPRPLATDARGKGSARGDRGGVGAAVAPANVAGRDTPGPGVAETNGELDYPRPPTHHRQPPADDGEEVYAEEPAEPLPAVLKRRSTMTADELLHEMPLDTHEQIANLEEALAQRPALGAPPRPTSKLPTPHAVQVEPVMSPALMAELRRSQGRRLKAWPFVLAAAVLVSLVLGGWAMIQLVKPSRDPVALGSGGIGQPAASQPVAQPNADRPVPPEATRPFTPVPTASLPLPANPVPPPRENLVLGQKEPTDADFPAWLGTELDRLIAQVEQPADFAAAYEGLKPVPPQAQTGKLQAFRAECLVERPNPNLSEARRLVDDAVQRGDAPAYARYVDARVRQAEQQPAAAAHSLGEAVKTDLSLHGFRKVRAVNVFKNALEPLKVNTDAKKVKVTSSASPADRAWLQAASKFAAAVPEAPRLEPHLHLYLLGDTESDHRDFLLTPAMRDELKKRPDGALILTSLLLDEAGQATASQPEQAVRHYADAATLLRSNPAANVLHPLEYHERLIRPGLDLEPKLAAADAESKAALATLHAAKGRLIWENPFESWPSDGKTPPYRLAAKEFGLAIDLCPATEPRRGEWRTFQGLCLVRLGLDKLSEEDWKQLDTDAQAAIAENPNYAGGWNLRGIVRYHQALRQASAEAASEKARESIAAYDRAIQLAGPSPKTDENLFFYFNNRSVAKVLLASYLPKAEKQLLLEQAKADAETATKLSPEFELAWGALGIALENLASKSDGLGQVALYPQAEAAFTQQVTLRPAESHGYLNRGRLLVKWLLDQGNDSARAAQAEKDLQEGLRRDASQSDGWFWLGRLRLREDKLPEAVAAFDHLAKSPKLVLAYLVRLESVLLPQHPQEMRQLITAALPKETANIEARHAALLLMRGNLVRGYFKSDLAAAKEDLDRAATLAEQPNIKAAAYEGAAAVRIELSRGNTNAEEVRRYRAEVLDNLRKLLQVESTLPSAWSWARTLATLLEADAEAATDTAQKKKLLEEAVQALRVAIDKAPAEQRPALERLRRGVQEKLATLAQSP